MCFSGMNFHEILHHDWNVMKRLILYNCYWIFLQENTFNHILIYILKSTLFMLFKIKWEMHHMGTGASWQCPGHYPGCCSCFNKYDLISLGKLQLIKGNQFCKSYHFYSSRSRYTAVMFEMVFYLHNIENMIRIGRCLHRLLPVSVACVANHVVL